MPLSPPIVEQVMEILEGMGIQVSPQKAEEHRDLIQQNLTVYEELDEFAEPNERRPKESHSDRVVKGRPDPNDNPLNIWVRKCE